MRALEVIGGGVVAFVLSVGIWHCLEFLIKRRERKAQPKAKGDSTDG